MLLFVFLRETGGFSIHTATPRTRKEFLSRQSLLWLRGRTIGALRAERHTSTFAEWTSCFACHELLCSRAFLFILWGVRNTHKFLAFCKFFEEIGQCPYPS